MERPTSVGAVPDEMPLSYGIVQPALNFLASLPAAPAHAAEGGAPCAERGGEASADDPLADFISFDESAGSQKTAAPPADSAPTLPPSRTTSHWDPRRRYDGHSPLLRVHEELVDFSRAFRPTKAEAEARRDVVCRLRELVAHLWPAAQVQVFGSYETGLFLPESDIDVLCIGTNAAPGRARRKALHRLGDALARAPWRVLQLEVVDSARVPIVKYVDGVSGIAVDVCLEVCLPR